MTEVKLHGFWYSPMTLRVVLTLKLKDIPYHNIEEDRFNKSLELLRYNPVYKRTPVFVHNGRPLCESMLIIEYIDEIWPHNSLVPADPYERALARFWAKYADDLYLDQSDNNILGQPLKFSAVVAFYLGNNGEEKEANIEKVWEHIMVVENKCFGDQKKFFGGDNINMVDLAFGPIVKTIFTIEDILEVKVLKDEKFPHFLSWYNNFKEVPIIKENLPEHEKMVACLKFIREKRLASS